MFPSYFSESRPFRLAWKNARFADPELDPMSVELSSTKYFQETEVSPIQPEPINQKTSRYESSAWSGRLTLICLLCGLFGVGGALLGALGILGTLSGPPNIRGGNHMSMVMQKKMIAAQKQFVVPQLFNSIVKIGVGAMLVLASVLMFSKKRNSRGFGQNACYAAIGSHLLSAAISAWSFITMSKIMKEAMASQMRQDQMEFAMGAFSFGGALFILGAFIFFVAIYGSMALHLGSPSVRRIFGENPYPEKADMLRNAGQAAPASC